MIKAKQVEFIDKQAVIRYARMFSSSISDISDDCLYELENILKNSVEKAVEKYPSGKRIIDTL